MCCDLARIILDYPELSRADLATYAALLELGESAYEVDLAALAGLSERHTRRAIHRLELAGLIKCDRVYNKDARKTKNFYQIMSGCPQDSAEPNRTEMSGCPQDSAEPNRTEMSGCPQDSAKNEVINRVTGQKCPPMNHDDDDDYNKKLNCLYFFTNELVRKELATLPSLTVEAAMAWQAWYEKTEHAKGWKNPAGFAYKHIKLGEFPPSEPRPVQTSLNQPVQIPLPGGVYEVTAPYIVAAQTAAQLELGDTVVSNAKQKAALEGIVGGVARKMENDGLLAEWEKANLGDERIVGFIVADAKEMFLSRNKTNL